MGWDPNGQQVTCKTCGVTYECTSRSDYYNSTNATDGECELCLLSGAGFDPKTCRLETVVVRRDR